MDQSPAAATVHLTGSAELPRWDLSALYPGIDTPEFDDGFARVLAQIEALQGLFDELGVQGGGSGPAGDSLVQDFERALSALNNVEQDLESTVAYLYGQITVDSRDAVAQARYSQLRERMVQFDKLQTRFEAWVGALPIDELVDRSAVAAAHAYPLRLRHAAAAHLMGPDEEALAAELSPSAGAAWSKLHANLTSQIQVPVDVDGEERLLPMSEVRNLALSPDRILRERAWQAELAGWEANALPIAAALNGVKGQVLALGARRGWPDSLDESLFWSGIDREILDAMIGEARDSFPDFRRYLRLKAKYLGTERLAWFDLLAPVGDAGGSWAWGEAAAFIDAQFASFSGRMAGLARQAFAEHWIDAEPRPGKVGGAYCMRLIGEQSRILANYSPGYEGVSVLAHELGHAYHNLNGAGLTPMQRRNPMILAETASTFCETIVKEAALEDAAGGKRLYILEQSLQGACQVVVDILSRFEFETALFAGRRERELSAIELCRLMLEAQQATYGEGLDADARHPYMWAVKGHYYSPEQSFYNFPYLFGLLFGLGLYAIYRREPKGFPERYDELLAKTGLATATDLAGAFGIDLRSREFWRASLDVIRADVDRFAEMVEG